MGHKPIEDIYPLSPMQQGMLFHSLYALEKSTYFEQSHWILRGALDLQAFEQAWQRVIERHPILRTAFMWEDLEQPLQVVHHRATLSIAYRDGVQLSGIDWRDGLAALLLDDRKIGFDISKAPLMRLTLIRTGEDEHSLVWSHHHLLLDGWSLPLLFQEVMAFYQAMSKGQECKLPPARPYREYVAWLQKQDMEAAERFWRGYLKGFSAPTAFMADRGERIPPAAGSRGSENDYALKKWLLPQQTAGRMRALAQTHQLTLNTLMQGAWAILLGRYSGEDDVVFGSTVSGRPADLPGSEAMIGLFINTLPVRVDVRPGQPVLSWLRGLQIHQAEMRQYEYSPLVNVQGWSEIQRGMPLFESIVVFENYPIEDALQGFGRDESLQIEVGEHFTRVNYPLTLAISPGREIGLEVGYDCHRFDSDAIERMLGHLKAVLEAMAADPQQRIGELGLLTEAEHRQVVYDWNETAASYPSQQCLHELFEEQVRRHPRAAALRFEGQELSYAELNRRANQLGHYLRKLGVGPEVLVGICAERGFEMVVGVLGVLKAGGAYVPLDPQLPSERLGFILQDTGLSVLLSQQQLLERLPAVDCRVVRLDADWDEIGQESDQTPQSGVGPQNLAYVIYTSGSTGTPKGTLLQHRGVCNYVNSYIDNFRLGTDSCVLQFAAFSFDASVAEIFSALLSGALLCLCKRDALLSSSDLVRLMRETPVTMAILPPSLLSVISTESLDDLRILMSAGEACPPEVAGRWAAGRRFFNGYGPTEASVGPMLHEVSEGLLEEATIPIGRPLPNLQVYLLNRHLQPVPVGVSGEICIGGVGLARGYLGRADLTGERFIPDPYGVEAGGRLYRTGDLGRFRPDGTVEFLGRLDHQVKLRGFRIEIGEIEAVLTGHPGLQQAAVVLREGAEGQKYLAAYVVSRQGPEAAGVEELRGYLRQRLPEYMVPAVFVQLGQLPVTASGKVDRRALPAPDESLRLRQQAYVAPRGPVEGVLAEQWQQVLGAERVGVFDNFYDLGGHSLLATQLISRVQRVFGVELGLRDLFETLTVAGLARRVEAVLKTASGVGAPALEPVSRQQPLALSFAQERLWFLDQLSPGHVSYNIPMAVRLEGVLDVAALVAALNAVVQRHEVLRTRFEAVGGRPVQVVEEGREAAAEVEDLSALSAAEREAEAQRRVAEAVREPFDLARGPLWRVRFLRLAPDEHLVLLVMHHIVSDGWSVQVLTRELAVLYDAFSKGQPNPLPALPIQYADFAHWQRGWLAGEVLERQLAYWSEQLKGSPPMLELPWDRPRPAVQSARGAMCEFALSGQLSERLRQLSRQQDATLFMTLLSVFQVLLYRYTGQTDICVGTPIANRTRQEIEGLIGFFVNTLVLRGDLSADPSFEQLLVRTRQAALGAYTHQDLPFELLVEALRPERNLSHTPLFQVMFVMNAADSEGIELSGLRLKPVAAFHGAAVFDLTLALTETGEGLSGYVEYNADLFDGATIERLLGHYERLLEAVAADSSRPISELPMLSSAERRQLQVVVNATAMPTPAGRCVQELVEAQAAERPEAAAVVFEGEQVSYGELNRRANQLAHYLIKRGVGPEVLVGLCTLRSPQMVVGMLGVLKAGGAYVPLDPSYPPERLVFMLQDSQARVLLTQELLVGQLALGDLSSQVQQVICLDADWGRISGEPDSNPPLRCGVQNLAYVIYTSGSTGQPKGTMLAHAGLSNLTGWQRQVFGIGPGSRVLQFSPLSFDASVWEAFMALANGGALVLGRQEVLASGVELARLLQAQAVGNVTLPPSVLRVLPAEDLPALGTIIVAGEKCTQELVGRWGRGREFFNAYGPTETTVCASMKRCDPAAAVDPPIGRPIANGRLYVVDASGQPVPAGVAGELCVGGVSVARGYLRRPELTAEKFVPDGVSGEPGGRLYRTGDLVRWRADGEIEFLGRIDDQVKVRGFRIELGEVEAALRAVAGVTDAAVVAQAERLVAYVVGPSAPGSAELRGLLRRRLPEYLVPSVVVAIERLPLSPSGKVDRKALPAPDAVLQDREYTAPRNELERQLAQMVAELLELEQVGVFDNFFELGGHSLLATQLISRIREQTAVELPLRTLFEHPTVAELAEAHAREQAREKAAMTKAPAITALPRDAHRVKKSAVQ